MRTPAQATDAANGEAKAIAKTKGVNTIPTAPITASILAQSIWP